MNGVLSSGVRNEDEGLYPVQHGYWLQTMTKAVDAEEAAAAQVTNLARTSVSGPSGK